MKDSLTRALPSGTLLQGKVYTYRIEKVLGQGSFGITYLASTQIPGPLGEVTVQVALKEFFAKDLDSRMADGTVTARTLEGVAHRYARAFLRESDNLSKMAHPGIVNVLESFEAKGTCYYSMEYLPGGTLDAKVRGAGLPEAEALPLIAKIGEALSYMHDRKMMHLDLKPNNIMLKSDGTPVIIDFGLSKQYDTSGEPESSTTIGLGTPGYAPIEQANQTSGRTFQPTIDIYALGATLYKMLTGSTPPIASDILNEGFPEEPLKEKRVSSATLNAVRKAMSAAKKDRPQTVAAFLSLLSGILEETEIKPTPKPSPKPKPTPVPPPAPVLASGKKPSKAWLWALLGGLAVAAIITAIVLGGRVPSVAVSAATGSINGHEWVDLGLPSGLKWATSNVGANSPSDYGNYYAWGETSTKSNYDWSTYRYCNGSSNSLTKYNTSSPAYGTVDNRTRLEMSDDAARVNWGGSWRLPTDAEWTELRENCNWMWARLDGKNGYKVTSRTNGNSIFLPAAGHRYESSLYNAGSFGDYWSSSLYSDYPGRAWRVLFNSVAVDRINNTRCHGQSVRSVSE